MIKTFHASRFTVQAVIAFLLPSTGLLADELKVGAGETYTKIQAAIDAAQDNDVVKVKDGIYSEAIDFKGKKITVVSLSGSLKATIDATGLVKTSVVSFKTAETAASVLEGFTLTGGTGTPLSATPAILQGGGILVDKSTPTVKDCIITKNTATKGGGIMIQGIGGGGTFQNCEVTENQATAASLASGAGICLSPTGTTAYEILFQGVNVRKNWAKGAGTIQGGGVYAQSTNANLMVKFLSCTVSENVMGSTNPPTVSSGDGGGYYLETVPVSIGGGEISGNIALRGGGLALKTQGVKSSITGTAEAPVIIQGNKTTAAGGGGAIHFPSTFTSRLTLSHIRFLENSGGSQGGGAILNEAGAPIIDHCLFADNTTTQDGGAIRFIPTGAKTSVTNTQFLRNHADLFAGAVYMSSSTAAQVIFGNCIFAKNTCASGGGAVYNKSPAGQIQKFLYCTFVGNTSTSGIGGLACDAATAGLLVWNSILWGNTPTDFDATLVTKIGYSDVKLPAIAKAGMLNVDPGFVAGDADPGDYHLATGSQLIDKGNIPATDPDVKAITLDLDGKERASGGLPDMGAYEFQQAPVVKPKFIRGLCRKSGADISKADINIGDPIYLLRWLLSVYPEPGCVKGCDANDSGQADISDAIFLLNFLFKGSTAPVAPFPALGEDPSLDQLTCKEGKLDG